MKGFFTELARRNVIRVTAAYMVLAWIILQVLNNLAPAVSLPEWSSALLVVILLAGFPIVVIAAWAFEMTPDGLKKTAQSKPEQEGQLSPFDMALAALLVLVVIVAGTSLWKDTPLENFQASDDIESALTSNQASRLAIAVLPFVDMSPEGDQDWFSDGISEEIIHRLVQQKELTVAGRTSSFYFKGKNVPFEEIGRILSVGTVLEGSVRKDGQRVRITAQLIDIESGAHRWSGTFDRELKDIFRIQEDLSIAISRELLRELGIEPAVPEIKPYEPNIEAYQTYLRGRQIFSVDLRKVPEATRLFRRAADLDPNYVDPLAGLLLNVAWFGGGWILEGSDQVYDPGELLAEALARNPSPANRQQIEGHAAFADWRFAEAEKKYRRYAELMKTDPSTRTLAAFLTFSGRHREAIPMMEKYLAAEPLDGLVYAALGSAYFSTGRYEDGKAVTEKVIELGFPILYEILVEQAGAAVARNDRELYEYSRQKISEFSGRRIPERLRWRIWDAQLSANDEELRKLKQEAINSRETTSDEYSLILLAEICALLGEDEEALKWYRISAEARHYNFRYMMSIPQQAPLLTSTPQGRAILTEAGYDPAWFDDPEEGVE